MRPLLVGQSPAMLRVLDLVRRVGPTSATVLIVGESGTGKELVAQALQQAGPRADRPYVRVHCGAIPESLLESELFGHEKGAFTGAVRARKGRFELADGGTLFLDEIGDMSPGAQIRLLRVLQEGEFDRVGGTRPRRVDVRVLAATHVDLQAAIERGRFREDLYYRLQVVQIPIPPLRERRDDIPLLLRSFLERYTHKHGKRIAGVMPDALAMLQDHDWPGNVRELENAVERAVILARDPWLRVEDLRGGLQLESPAPLTFPVGTSLAEVERRMLEATLRHTRGDKREAARLLGITVRTVYRRLQRQRQEQAEAPAVPDPEPEATPGTAAGLPMAEALPDHRP